MPKVYKSVLVPYSAERMYELVERVEDYPQFLPWCAGITVQERSENRLVATLHIAFKGIKQSFTTANVQTPSSMMQMNLVDGPFKHLEGLWRFTVLEAQACKVEFELDYSFSSTLLEKVIGPVFGIIAATFIDGFVRRAEALYG